MLFRSALAQGLLAGIGLAIAGVPAAPLLGLAVFFLSIVPVGPPIVWGSAALWLLWNDSLGWAVFMALWGVFVISGVDNVLKPYLISRGGNLPLVVVLLGVFGGVLAFGFMGLFLGPTLLAVAYSLLGDWLIKEVPEVAAPERLPIESFDVKSPPGALLATATPCNVSKPTRWHFSLYLASVDAQQADAEAAAKKGAFLRKRLDGLKKKFACIGDVRGKGLYQMLDIVTDPQSRKPDPAMAERIRYHALAEGLLVICVKNYIRICPPAIMTHEEVKDVVGRLGAAIQRAKSDHRMDSDYSASGSLAADPA